MAGLRIVARGDDRFTIVTEQGISVEILTFQELIETRKNFTQMIESVCNERIRLLKEKEKK